MKIYYLPYFLKRKKSEKKRDGEEDRRAKMVARPVRDKMIKEATFNK